MNISEKNEQVTEGVDLLIQMFDKQREVESKFAKVEGVPERLVFGKLENLHHPEVCRYLSEQNFWRLIQEVNEAVVALKNAKRWRQTNYAIDVQEYLDEIADIMIFFINVCMASGIDPKMLTQIVLNKIAVNEDRVTTKY